MSATRFAIEHRIPVSESKEKFRDFFGQIVMYIDQKGLYHFDGIHGKVEVISKKLKSGDYSKDTIQRIGELYRFCETFRQLSLKSGESVVVDPSLEQTLDERSFRQLSKCSKCETNQSQNQELEAEPEP